MPIQPLLPLDDVAPSSLSRRPRFLVDISSPLRHTHRMIIRCLRTGAVLEKDLTITTAGEALVRRIRDAAFDWLPENIEAVVNKYKRTGQHPFMFDAFAGSGESGRLCWIPSPTGRELP